MMTKRDAIEQHIASHLLQAHPQASSSVHDFLVYLTAAARHGHLCVEVTENTVKPLPHRLWQEKFQLDSDPANEVPNIQSIIAGAGLIPADLLTEADSHTTDPATPLCRWGSRYYLHRHWTEETAFLHHLERVLQVPPRIMPNLSTIQNRVEALIATSELQPEQATAILCACEHPVALISGGPGTGKTYTAGQFVRLFLENLSAEERAACQIAVAAPTGKAASQLEASLTKYGAQQIQAQTLHALLRIRSDRTRLDEVRPHSADLFLIDEGSMIDLRMMAHLFASAKPGARIVLLGDKDQLPSIEAGNIFADLVRSGRCPCVQLQRSLRTESVAILTLASAIREGKVPSTLSLRPLEPTLLTEAASYFDYTTEEPEQILRKYQQFRLLSPLRKGQWGMEETNRQLLQLCRQRNRASRFYVPIMITRNDDPTGLFNGEVGLLVNEEYAIFNTAKDGLRQISATLLPPYEYAYCMSVHKSQGSEFDTVWLLLPEGSEVFGREMFYTAVTRAKKQIQVWGSDLTAASIVAHKSERLSGIGGDDCASDQPLAKSPS